MNLTSSPHLQSNSYPVSMLYRPSYKLKDYYIERKEVFYKKITGSTSNQTIVKKNRQNSPLIQGV